MSNARLPVWQPHTSPYTPAEVAEFRKRRSVALAVHLHVAVVHVAVVEPNSNACEQHDVATTQSTQVQWLAYTPTQSSARTVMAHFIVSLIHDAGSEQRVRVPRFHGSWEPYVEAIRHF